MLPTTPGIAKPLARPVSCHDIEFPTKHHNASPGSLSAHCNHLPPRSHDALAHVATAQSGTALRGLRPNSPGRTSGGKRRAWGGRTALDQRALSFLAAASMAATVARSSSHLLNISFLTTISFAASPCIMYSPPISHSW